MAKQKQDNKTVDIELLILRDKIEELIGDYEEDLCENGSEVFLSLDDALRDLRGLLND